MILKEETFEKFGYYVGKLSHGSDKPILARCDKCGKVRITTKHAYRALCHLCATSKPIEISRDDLEKEYWTNELSLSQIADKYNVSTHKVKWLMIKFKIKRRTRSEALRLHHPFLGKHHTEETKRKIREKKKKQGKEISKALKQRWKNGVYDTEAFTVSHREAIKKAIEVAPLKRDNDTWKHNLSVALEIAWLDPVKAARMVKNRGKKPNKKELLLDSILQTNFPNEWKYVGDSKFIIGRLCPDWININGGKRVIELFGCYWHGCKKCGFDRLLKDTHKEDYRIRYFNDYGFKTLIIWEHELTSLDKIIKKIDEWNV